jgi:hypothetical protein
MAVVRWPDKWRGIHLSLIFLLLFVSRQKEDGLALRQKVNNQSTFLTFPDPEIFCLTAGLPLY